MTPREHLAAYERIMAAAMTAADPVAHIRAAAADPEVPASLRALLSKVDPGGVELTAVLVARMRFERLICGCPEAEAWFDCDPEGFTTAFRTYHRRVPPTAFFPADEAALFRRWWAESSKIAS